MSGQKAYDVAVVGAGVFGAWTAWHLAKRGKKVALIDGYGPANARASSGGESRIIRMGYGADELYTQWSQNSLAQWKKFLVGAQPPPREKEGLPDGLILEVHPCPEKAVSDGAQSLTIQGFRDLMRDLQPYIRLWKDARAGVAVGA